MNLEDQIKSNALKMLEGQIAYNLLQMEKERKEKEEAERKRAEAARRHEEELRREREAAEQRRVEEQRRVIYSNLVIIIPKSRNL